MSNEIKQKIEKIDASLKDQSVKQEMSLNQAVKELREYTQVCIIKSFEEQNKKIADIHAQLNIIKKLIDDLVNQKLVS